MLTCAMRYEEVSKQTELPTSLLKKKKNMTEGCVHNIKLFLSKCAYILFKLSVSVLNFIELAFPKRLYLYDCFQNLDHVFFMFNLFFQILLWLKNMYTVAELYMQFCILCLISLFFGVTL